MNGRYARSIRSFYIRVRIMSAMYVGTYVHTNKKDVIGSAAPRFWSGLDNPASGRFD